MSRYKYIFLCICSGFIFVTMSDGVFSFAEMDEEKLDCSIKNIEHFSSIDLKKLSNEEFSLQGISTEGANIQVYSFEMKVPVIKAILYGEWGKTIISFYFSSKKDFGVEVIKQFYDRPITNGPVQIVEENIKKFVVCNVSLLNYPAASDIKNEHQMVTNILQLIINSDHWDQTKTLGSK